MSLSLFPVRVPIGRATDANGRRYDVLMTPEFARALSDLLARVGGEDGMGSEDIARLAAFDTVPAGRVPDSDLPGADIQVAALRREVAELRLMVHAAQPGVTLLREVEQMRTALAMVEDPAALVRYLKVSAAKPSNLDPLANGSADAGTSKLYSRADHVHPETVPSAGNITGSRGGNAALASLLTALAAIGLLVDSTTP